VLSNGHGSMLLYSLLHLSGFDLQLDQLRDFRQWGSHTPGHPERDLARGIETTTGPLGQGFGNGVGMAIAERHLRSVFGSELVNHHTYGFVSDGDLMEGVSSEAASIAGHLGLGRIVYLYDDNGITIDGSTDLAFSEDVPKRFDSYGWHTTTVDGHDRRAVEQAIREALAVADHPSLISCKTHIGHGSPNKQDTSSVHGSPLGDDEIALVKELMGWDAPPFHVPDEVYEFFSLAMDRGRDARRAWESRRDGVFASDAEVAGRWSDFWSPQDVSLDGPAFDVGSSLATRKASSAALNEIAAARLDLVGGSADLTPSTNTFIDGSGSFTADHPEGRNFHFGIREHGMAAAVNGIVLHGGLRAFGATFLTFSDYMRASVRLSGLMEIPSIWVWTHDSVFLGEDGPTHQPIEHLSALRAIPGLHVYRPADATETAEAWQAAINRVDGPSAIVLTRQGVPVLERPNGGVARGGYTLRDGSNAALVATGSEVWVALEAAALLADRDIDLRVVSMPCVEAFLEQPADYRQSVLGDGPVASVEAGTTWGWDRITKGGLTMGIDHYGASAPHTVLAEQYGLTPTAVADRVAGWLAGETS
ncbi:MAG: transketolase, partial [Acidimicrobiia bacterium]|nr:transketolase [Acidimicrobiia bacterium]